MRDLFQHAVDLNEMELSDFRAVLAKLGIKGRMFNDLLKAARAKTEQAKQAADEMPQILGGGCTLSCVNGMPQGYKSA